MMKVLLTTPDFPPKIGGLSTFSKNIMSVLSSFEINLELLIWSSPQDLYLKSKQLKNNFDFVVNIHSLPSPVLELSAKEINFFHGSEVLFYSKNIFKRIFKKIYKNKMIKSFEMSEINFFVSEFTFNKIVNFGYKKSFDRDIILHNCIMANDNILIKQNITNKLCFVCIARDVPHKNLDGAYLFAKKVSEKFSLKTQIYITSKRFKSTDKLEVINIEKNISDEGIKNIYKKSHINLLLSLDHSRNGFYEGFGLTVLEAGIYGVPSIVYNSGGLKESVHDQYTGWILDSFEDEGVIKMMRNVFTDYQRVSKNCYEHTIFSHSIDIYRDCFARILGL